jgi:hypothetical protein
LSPVWDLLLTPAARSFMKCTDGPHHHPFGFAQGRLFSESARRNMGTERNSVLARRAGGPHYVGTITRAVFERGPKQLGVGHFSRFEKWPAEQPGLSIDMNLAFQ